jgi:hypothetical protein
LDNGNIGCVSFPNIPNCLDSQNSQCSACGNGYNLQYDISNQFKICTIQNNPYSKNVNNFYKGSNTPISKMILSSNQNTILYINKNSLTSLYMNGGNIKANIIDNCYTFNNICGNSDLSTIIAVRDKTTTVAYKTISEG